MQTLNILIFYFVVILVYLFLKEDKILLYLFKSTFIFINFQNLDKNIDLLNLFLYDYFV